MASSILNGTVTVTLDEVEVQQVLRNYQPGTKEITLQHLGAISQRIAEGVCRGSVKLAQQPTYSVTTHGEVVGYQAVFSFERDAGQRATELAAEATANG